jgi:glutamine synthetase
VAEEPFEDKSDKHGLDLSQLAYHFAGRSAQACPALAALCCPTVNSYKRLVVGRSLTGATWAPAYICYGGNNRSGMIRSPGGRLELRLPDASCNAYLATAAVIAAGMDGVSNALDPGAAAATTTCTNTARRSWMQPASAYCRRTCMRRLSRSKGPTT